MAVNAQQVAELIAEFDRFRFTYEDQEAWSARDLQTLLGYDKWQNFQAALERAMTSCAALGKDASKNFLPFVGDIELDAGRIFTGVGKNSGRGRPRENLVLSRYAAYLTAMNADPAKPKVAFAQAYFAFQTRKMEVLQKRLEDAERLAARKQLTLTEKELSKTLADHGVDSEGFGIVRSAGDKVLFGGLNTAQMKDRLKIDADTPLADHLQTVLIRAKDFAAEITAYNTRAKKLHGLNPIVREHEGSNRNVRKALTESGITPERVPAAESTKEVAKRLKKDPKLVGKEAPDLPPLPSRD